jgi:hypothetical protein
MNEGFFFVCFACLVVTNVLTYDGEVIEIIH